MFLNQKTSKIGILVIPDYIYDFLAGDQSYKCTPWGNPTRNIFGWQKPCYLIGEGYKLIHSEN